MEEKNKYWSNSCHRLYSCKRDDCLCYSDYLMWTTEYPELDFNTWKELIKIERTDLL